MTEPLHIVCPHCGGVNRIPAGRNPAEAKCGRCHQTLFDGHPSPATSDQLEAQISKGDLPVLVDFWAEWCGPCKMMAPAFAEAARALEPAVRLLKVDTEAEQQAAMRYGIRSIPTLLLFRDGREIARQPGATNAAGITAWTRQHLA